MSKLITISVANFTKDGVIKDQHSFTETELTFNRDPIGLMLDTVNKLLRESDSPREMKDVTG